VGCVGAISFQRNADKAWGQGGGNDKKSNPFLYRRTGQTSQSVRTSWGNRRHRRKGGVAIHEVEPEERT